MKRVFTNNDDDDNNNNNKIVSKIFLALQMSFYEYNLLNNIFVCVNDACEFEQASNAVIGDKTKRTVKRPILMA